MADAVKAVEISAWYGKKLALRDVSFTMEPAKVTAIIGPSGCGKSTFLRSINRLHEVIPGARVAGEMWVGDDNVYRKGLDPIKVRAHIGMVFQRPNPFPTMSVFDNVGLRPPLEWSAQEARPA